MDGQFSIFDVGIKQDRRKPCEYAFARYIGQKVATNRYVGTICKIEPYYTHIRTADGEVVAGSPHDLVPLDLLRKDDSIKCHDKEDAANVADALCDLGINWDFTYNKNGEKGIWIDILEDEEVGDDGKRSDRA